LNALKGVSACLIVLVTAYPVHIVRINCIAAFAMCIDHTSGMDLFNVLKTSGCFDIEPPSVPIILLGARITTYTGDFVSCGLARPAITFRLVEEFIVPISSKYPVARIVGKTNL
jgi:hypothetical protein